jgi:hypothetical protein
MNVAELDPLQPLARPGGRVIWVTRMPVCVITVARARLRNEIAAPLAFSQSSTPDEDRGDALITVHWDRLGYRSTAQLGEPALLINGQAVEALPPVAVGLGHRSSTSGPSRRRWRPPRRSCVPLLRRYGRPQRGSRAGRPDFRKHRGLLSARRTSSRPASRCPRLPGHFNSFRRERPDL